MSKLSIKHSFKAYHPLPKFPPLSLSGTHCELNCRHCNRVYLTPMRPAQTPEALLNICRQLQRGGAVGALISGGSGQDGRLLNLVAMIPALQRVRAETGLILNLHPGLMDAAMAASLRDAVDFASLDVPSAEALQHVLGLEATPEMYLNTYRHLRAAGIPVAPHVTVFDGTEASLLEPLTAPHGGVPPEVVVVIVFTPTRGTAMANVRPPSPEAVGRVVAELKALFPASEISLGCMRPRSHGLHFAIEQAALEAGVTRMEMPTRKTLELAVEGDYTIEHFDACCSLPAVLEPRARRPMP